ncbi:winged helix-turn-helix domain-containing protein [Streptomyces sp. NPDC059690]|uniref:helix-turn-helix domain-containing protein n=1 Tax=Streptomyces sp. NPDC059690 TaxID=3346907 RepID=UPI0036C016D3
MKTLIGRLFHISYTVEGTCQPLKRHGWSWQHPARRAIERDDEAERQDMGPSSKGRQEAAGAGRGCRGCRRPRPSPDPAVPP